MTTKQVIAQLRKAQDSLWNAIFALDSIGAKISAKEAQKIAERCKELETLIDYEDKK